VDSLLDLVLDLYRVARDAPVTDFPDLALEMIKSIVRFRSATLSEANLTAAGIVSIFSVRLHNEPGEVRSKFASLNRRFVRRLFIATQRPGRSSVLEDSPAYYRERDEAPMRAYIRRYGHERNLLITDLRQWLSLYRPARDEAFTRRDMAIVDALMPHLVEALGINREISVARGCNIEAKASRGHAFALIDRNGVFLHCGQRFVELLRLEWPDWYELNVPCSLLSAVQRSQSAEIAEGRVRIFARPFGDAILLSGRKAAPLERLSPQELVIAREFGVGKSYKVIARDLQLAPATVRNVLQRTYRKLDIDNKAALARILELDS